MNGFLWFYTIFAVHFTNVYNALYTQTSYKVLPDILINTL